MSQYDVMSAFYKIFEHLAENPDKRNIELAKWIIDNSITDLSHIYLEDFEAEDHLIKLGLATRYTDKDGNCSYNYYPELEEMNDTFTSTAIYPNRLEDKEKLETKLGLSEKGDDTTEFYLESGKILAKGYTRIVYGDHGPYIEFEMKHIKCILLSKFGNTIDCRSLPENPKYYYYWLYPNTDKDVKVYLQLKPVTDLPNAPKRADGKRSRFNRKEGYADYKHGYFYVNPYEIKNIKKQNNE